MKLKIIEKIRTNNFNDEYVMQKITDMWKKEDEGQFKRAYTYDFEKYYTNGNIDIYIAVL